VNEPTSIDAILFQLKSGIIKKNRATTTVTLSLQSATSYAVYCIAEQRQGEFVDWDVTKLTRQIITTGGEKLVTVEINKKEYKASGDLSVAALSLDIPQSSAGVVASISVWDNNTEVTDVFYPSTVNAPPGLYSHKVGLTYVGIDSSSPADALPLRIQVDIANNSVPY
jgi:hypothetical protein